MSEAKRRVACLLGQGFEDAKFRQPLERMKADGHQVDIIGTKAGEAVAGKRGKERVRAEQGIGEVKPEDYEALFIPGGHSPDHLCADARFVDFVRRFDGLGRPLFAICHAAQLMMSAGIIGRGRTLTAWKTVQQDLRYTGGTVKDEPVVRDGNWLTSRQPDDLDAFGEGIVQMLREVPSTQLPSTQRPEQRV
jgi:protease I